MYSPRELLSFNLPFQLLSPQLVRPAGPRRPYHHPLNGNTTLLLPPDVTNVDLGGLGFAVAAFVGPTVGGGCSSSVNVQVFPGGGGFPSCGGFFVVCGGCSSVSVVQ